MRAPIVTKFSELIGPFCTKMVPDARYRDNPLDETGQRDKFCTFPKNPGS
jgi:hypothetical protein